MSPCHRVKVERAMNGAAIRLTIIVNAASLGFLDPAASYVTVRESPGQNGVVLFVEGVAP